MEDIRLIPEVVLWNSFRWHPQGKDLVKNPVMKIRFGEGEGCLVLSQLIMEGRLAEGYAPEKEFYPVKYDEAAVQFVLNMMESALNK